MNALPQQRQRLWKCEKLTRAKVDSVANRRLIASELGNGADATVKKLFTVLGPRYAKRNGGYTRVLKMGYRQGDAADVVILELVDYKLPEADDTSDSKSTKKAKAAKAEA